MVQRIGQNGLGNVGVGFARDRLVSRRSTQHAPDLDNFTCPSLAYCPGVSTNIL